MCVCVCVRACAFFMLYDMRLTALNPKTLNPLKTLKTLNDPKPLNPPKPPKDPKNPKRP